MLAFLIDLIFIMFGGQSALLCVLTVLLLSPTCSIIHKRQTSYIGFWRKTKRSSNPIL